MGFWGTTTMALQAAYLAAKRVYLDPSQVARGADTSARFSNINYLWAQYRNSAFESVSAWQHYVESLGLYRFTRSIYNPTKRAVQFASGQMYPGVLTPDGLPLPDGTPLAIPLSRDTPEELRLAIAQAWLWGWWLKNIRLAIRYSAATGSALVEAGDFPDKGRVAPVVQWPGHIPEFRLDQFGNLKRYVVEYQAEDDAKNPYTYRREVDGETTKTFKDGTPTGFDGAPEEFEHGYGFAPAVWLKHRDEGSDVGAPAISSYGPIDELNSLVSHIHDQIHVEVDNPAVLWFKGTLGRLGSTETNDALRARPRGDKVIITGPESGKVESLAGNLDLAATDTHIVRLIDEIEENNPELKMWRELRSMSQVTGPGAQRMLGDVQSVVGESQAGYDQQFVKLHQMLVAIGGERANSGAWGRNLTDAQQKFLPFNLSSYGRGKLDHSIDPRPLVPETQSEKWAASLARAAAATAWQPLLGGSAVMALEQVGFTEDELRERFTQNADAIAAEQLLAQADVPVRAIGDGSQPPQQ